MTAANTLPIDIDALSEDILISGCVYLPLPPYLRCVVLNVFFLPGDVLPHGVARCGLNL